MSASSWWSQPPPTSECSPPNHTYNHRRSELLSSIATSSPTHLLQLLSLGKRLSTRIAVLVRRRVLPERGLFRRHRSMRVRMQIDLANTYLEPVPVLMERDGV